ncbi:MAG: hypothetical protein JSS49_06405 [Planctomycetes bacterium]|nr:hypothetical protein [Planctomycetota bacterium]
MQYLQLTVVWLALLAARVIAGETVVNHATSFNQEPTCGPRAAVRLLNTFGYDVTFAEFMSKAKHLSRMAPASLLDLKHELLEFDLQCEIVRFTTESGKCVPTN